MILSDEDHPKEWGAKTVSKEDGAITVRIFTPPNCYVAKWNFKLDTIIKKEKTEEDPEPGSKVFRYAHVNPIYIIFNPWCPGKSKGGILAIIIIRQRRDFIQRLLNDVSTSKTVVQH